MQGNSNMKDISIDPENTERNMEIEDFIFIPKNLKIIGRINPETGRTILPADEDIWAEHCRAFYSGSEKTP